MSKSKIEIPAEKIALYEELVQTHPEIEKKGKTTPYTSVNGHMFSFLTKEGTMGLRLSSEDRQIFMDQYQSELMEQHGRTMKEYVVVPDHLFSDTTHIKDYLKKSYDYVAGLKPKPTKKKSAK